jgi:hypothetical protein
MAAASTGDELARPRTCTAPYLVVTYATLLQPAPASWPVRLPYSYQSCRFHQTSDEVRHAHLAQ